MYFGIHALVHNQIATADLKGFFYWILENGHQISISSSISKSAVKAGFHANQFPVFVQGDNLDHLDMILSLGGDGTILDSILFAVPNNLPIFGINFGRLGFLTSSQIIDYQDVIKEIGNKNFRITERALLNIQIAGEPLPSPNLNFALNELSITKRDSASMITVRTDVNGSFLNDYWGDGLIVSTPTGSTGYSLSCGGPILWPESKGLIITPISAHNLSMRPVVLPEDAIIDLTPRGRQQKVMLSMDSRSKHIATNQTISISVSKKVARFVRVADESFSQTLREKLFWGKDIRN